MLQQVFDNFVRLNEIKLLTSADAYTRELAKSALQNKHVPMDLPEALAKIPQQAAEARLKRTKERLGSGFRGRTSYNNFRYNTSRGNW